MFLEEVGKMKKRMYLFFVTALAVSLIFGCSFSGSDSVDDTTAPVVTAFYPADGATAVAINTTLIATFDEAMSPATITAANFTVTGGVTPVTGTVTYNEPNMTAVFQPATNLDGNTMYTASILTGVKDASGNALAASASWNFTTGTEADTIAPSVVSTFPVNMATGVLSNSVVTVTFSEAMDPATIIKTNFSLKTGGTAVSGTVTYDLSNNKATFTPASNMTDTLHTALVTTGVKDAVGNALATSLEWSFTPGISADTTAPTVTATFPINTATGTAVNEAISATFSEPMDSATITAVHFMLANGTTPVTGTVTYDLPNKKAIFSPAANLLVGTTYTATVTNGVKDLAGNALGANKVWTFTTSPAGLGPAPVFLGTAGNYVLLAKSAISTVPASVITGDIGLSPAAESYMTGFSQTKATGYSTSPQVTGFMYAADMTPPTPSNMTTAVSDMETAYNDAAGRSDSVISNLNGGTLNGQTLAPGLYKWGSTLNITGNITIAGTANDVWIFQITNNLTVSSSVEIILSGGAKAKNIFWQVAEIASLGTGARFEGIILSKTEVRMLTGASLNGRALAQTQISLDQATVTKPAP
jgi:hypothetical protein